MTLTAKRYPVILNGVRFLINPKHLSVKKALSMGSLNTQEGVKYQVWYEIPEVVEIAGQCAGDTAFRELQFLKDTYAKPDKVSEMYYKNRLYKGIITSMPISASNDYIFRYKYTINFQLLNKQVFAIEDLSVYKGNAQSLLNNITNTWELIDESWKETLDLKNNIKGLFSR